ncbi:MAG: PIN domain-containing protein [Wenzhouxiangella sp.]|jgi:tRNA(fMet)-specific endonuclease VapC|nr:PIN domain-containing protein [Wenzhouxiangella sp.]
MARYLLDTNILIAAIKGVSAVRSRLAQLDAADLVLSPVVLGELMVGVEKSRLKESNRAVLQGLMTSFECAPLDQLTAQRYGQVRAQLESEGRTIGGNDYWIAAQALTLDLTLVTDNTREFERVAGLKLENWLRPD